MKSPICDILGIEFPLLAFSHCRDVVAAVSRAGGFGVLGATAHSPETLERELKWIDDHADGKPYGVDVLIPENISTAGEKNVTWNYRGPARPGSLWPPRSVDRPVRMSARRYNQAKVLVRRVIPEAAEQA